jgi:hypothetical protein
MPKKPIKQSASPFPRGTAISPPFEYTVEGLLGVKPERRAVKPNETLPSVVHLPLWLEFSVEAPSISFRPRCR